MKRVKRLYRVVRELCGKAGVWLDTGVITYQGSNRVRCGVTVDVETGSVEIVFSTKPGRWREAPQFTLAFPSWAEFKWFLEELHVISNEIVKGLQNKEGVRE